MKQTPKVNAEVVAEARAETVDGALWYVPLLQFDLGFKVGDPEKFLNILYGSKLVGCTFSFKEKVTPTISIAKMH